MKYHFTESEIKKLAATFTVLHDTREQENGHILAWLERNSVAHKKRPSKQAIIRSWSRPARTWGCCAIYISVRL